MILSAEVANLAGKIKCSPSSSLYVVVTDTKKEAYYAVSDFDNFFGEDQLFFFPSASEKSEYKKATSQLQRTSALVALSIEEKKSSHPIIIVTYTEALDEKVLKPSKIRSSLLSIRCGESVSHSTINEVLILAGFHKVDFVTIPGEFALRGGLVDIFSFADEQPVRIDFFGDQVESIRHFSPDTQFSTGNLEKVDIYPNLDDNFGAGDYVAFKDLIPADAVLCDYRLAIKQSNTAVSSNYVPQPVFNKNFEMLTKDIIEKQEEGYTVNILSPNESQQRRLKEILKSLGLVKMPNFLTMSLHEGYIDRVEKVCWYTDHQIFDRYHKLKIHRQVERSSRMTINELNALQVGDYIVHIDHGVGQYGGLVKTNVGGKTQEAVKLIYRDGDVLFVSIHSLHRIARYKSRDAEAPKIYKLGSKVWENLKNSAKSKVKDIAKDLIKLYSERQHANGFRYSADSYLQHELESSFIYEDTPDQTTATEAVKADMESLHPMDRLICGDVGFGKTEVAIRAAFKAVCDSKQVAVLVPTTILALQHYRTFCERLSKFPCTIDYISRLRSAKEIKEIEQRLAQGKIDILIGTHRILNNSIKFKDIGLLIIDEEQKFGVTSKEKIRQMKSSIDTITLTATPIPRTLQFSLLGARDLSIINTPPPNRLPVTTEIINFDEEYLTEIITTELERGGQVYYVHNRVEDIIRVENMLHRLCPQADICVAHGQMESKLLEKKVLDFINGDYDILLSTTIIENGIDIPNANTMIIDQAHRFGLSDLHQLRGRVGRSNVKSFCYLIVPELNTLSDDARRRIKALEAFSDLGSGFNIAMQDLDIRGAGNLFGAEQSGFMAEMGFETYMRILKETMTEVRMERGVEDDDTRNSFSIDTTVDTDLELYIPDTYVNVPSEKIRLYRELDNITSENAIKPFIAHVADRFGSPLPVPFLELIDIVRLRLNAGRLGIEKVVLKNNTMLCYFVTDRNSSFYRSDSFDKILQKLSTFRIFTLTEANGRLHMKANNIDSVSQALAALNHFLV